MKLPPDLIKRLAPTIPKGYRLTVVSWENDGDNYNTKIKSGLTKEYALFFVDLCKAVDHDSEIANLYEPSDEEVGDAHRVLRDVMIKHRKADENEPLDEVGDSAMEYLYDLGLCHGEFFTRVCESFKVELVPEDVHFEDVTKDFT